MTKTSAVCTALQDSAAAGADLGRRVLEGLEGDVPDGVILFASSQFDYPRLLSAFSDVCRPKNVIGSSSAGEFTHAHRSQGTACALAIRSPSLQISCGVGQEMSQDRARAAADVLASFRGLGPSEHRYRTAIIMTDALAGNTDDLIEHITLLTSGKYQFVGGGAGDDARFTRTHVFHGTQAFSDAVVGMEILSDRPLGIGVGHGWIPASRGLRVTEAEGMRLVSLNGMPAVEAFEEYAEASAQRFDRVEPLPFFLHNVLGIDTGRDHRLRVPLGVNDDGSIQCAAEIPTGALVYIMKSTVRSAVEAAANATETAVAALRGGKPGAALLFDCVATRLRMGDEFGFELDSVARALQGAEFVGCNTYGQIARAEGQFSGFHNCTAVVLVLPA